MVAWMMALGGAAGYVLPTVGAGFIARIPGGMIGVAAVGLLLVWLGHKVDGLEEIAVGAGGGLLAFAVLSYLPSFGGRKA